MKGLFDVLKQYLDKIVHEVQDIAPSGTSSGAKKVTERTPGSGNATEQAVPESAGDVAEAVPEKPEDAEQAVPERAGDVEGADVGEVVPAGPHGDNDKKIENQTKATTTSSPSKKEPQESEQRWENLDDILKKLRQELGW